MKASVGDGVANLLNIFQAFAGWTDDQMRAHFSGMRYGELKKQVAEMTISQLEPFQQRYREMMSDPDYIPGILKRRRGASGPIANSTVELVKRRMGLYARDATRKAAFYDKINSYQPHEIIPIFSVYSRRVGTVRGAANRRPRRPLHRPSRPESDGDRRCGPTHG